MFDKMKQVLEMKRKMDELKRELEAVVLASEDSLVKVTITGEQKIKSVELKCEPAAVSKRELEASLTDTFNRAVKESQSAAAQKMGALGSLAGLGL